MFSAYLEDRPLWGPVLQHEVFSQSLAWLEKNAATTELGNYVLGQSGWYANVHSYETIPGKECFWENHRNTIDIQYLVSGREGIRWDKVGRLGEPCRYIEDQDREEYEVLCGDSSLLVMQPGMFAIFMPGEAHCPKIALGDSCVLRKVVVKIPRNLIEGGL